MGMLPFWIEGQGNETRGLFPLDSLSFAVACGVNLTTYIRNLSARANAFSH